MAMAIAESSALSVLSPLSIVSLLIIVYLVNRIVTKIYHELCLTRQFHKLPKFSHLGLASWVLGNVDIYFYAMSHLRVETAVLQIISSVYAIDSLRKIGFARFTLGYLRMVAFYRADTVEELVTSLSNVTKGHQYDYFKPWLGLGLLTSTGEHWKRHRKLLTPAFHFKILETFFPIMNKNVQQMLTRVEGVRKNEAYIETDIRQLITDMTLDTICETAMGTSVGAQSDTVDHQQYIAPINSAMILFMDRVINPMFQSDFIYSLSPSGKQNRANMAKIHRFISKVIKDRREELEKSIQEHKLDINLLEMDDVGVMTKKRYAFLDSLLVTHLRNPKEFTKKDIHDEVNTFMFEGHDTTSVGLIFALLLISSDTKVQDKIYEEIVNIVNEEEPIMLEHCRQMKYLEMCIKESLRLYPPVPSITRKVEHDFTVSGYRIPAGITASIHMYLLHRDPSVFPQPERFIPERFEPDAAVHRMPYAYMPFSAGPRNCIGQRFALLEMKIVIGSILRKYRLTAVTKRDQVEMAFAVLLKARSPVVIRFEKRSMQK